MTSRRAPLGLWLGALVVTAFVVRVVVPAWPDRFLPVFPDSFSFSEVAGRGPFQPQFWFDERPIGMPLLLWALGRSPRLLALVQATAYAVAAVALCAVLLRVLRSRVVGWLASVAVVAVCLQDRYGWWTTTMLSESLALTLAIASFAGWLAFAGRPSRRTLAAAMVLSLAWVLTRDSHVLPFAAVVLPATAVGAWRSSSPELRRALGRWTGAAVAVCLYVVISQDVSDRNRYPLMNDVGQRVLLDPSMTAWFVDHGMPLDDALRARTGRSSFDDGMAMLNDPALAEFRAWADGPGQRTQLLSFVLQPGFWTSHLRDDLPALLAADLSDYDLSAIGERLPEGLAVRSTFQLQLWTALAAAGLVLAVLARQRRLLSLVVALALASAWIDVYLSYAGDSVEVHRHLVGPLLRLTLAMLAAMAIGVDAVVARLRPVATRPFRPVTARDVASTALVCVGAAAVAAAWFANELRSQDYDPQFARTVVERAASVGGTYYQNGIHNKGPFEMFVYDASRWFTSWGSYWFAISTVVLILAAGVCAAAWVTGRREGAGPWVAGAGVVIVGAHMALSSSDYAGVVYSRNLTTAMLALTWAIALTDRWWRDRRWASWALVACGVLLGLAVQTLLTTALTASVVAVVVLVRRSDVLGAARSLVVLAGSGVATLVSAPVWYALRGSFDEFWAGWWVYARYMSAGTGRSLGNQAGLGWQRLLSDLHDRPEIVLLVAAFLLVTWVQWGRLRPVQRTVHAGLVAWLAAGWVELVLSQRYSSHYYAVVAVPLLLMVVALIARLDASLRRPGSLPAPLDAARRNAVAPLVALVLVIGLQCSDALWQGLRIAGGFTSFADHAAQREQSRAGSERSARAVLDLVGREADPVLAWTMYPWTYLDQHRVPATRLSWKSFMIGEIYLGRTSGDYVLPQTWRWFAEDMAATDPTALLTLTDTPVVPGTPFATYAGQNFTLAYPGPTIQVHLRNDLLGEVTGPVSDGRPWQPPSPATGWEVAEGSASTVDGAVPGSLPLSTSGCLRLGADLRLGAAGEKATSGIAVRLDDADGSSESVTLGFDGQRGWSASDNVQFESVALPEVRPESAIVLVVGERSAALVVDGTIVAATVLDGDVRVSLDSLGGPVALTDMVVGAAPRGSGC